jgi:protein arginine kinase activator
MRCDLCKKAKATVHLSQDPRPMAGDIVRVHLCSRCAKKHGLDDPTGFSLADLLSGLRNNEKPDSRPKSK